MRGGNTSGNVEYIHADSRKLTLIEGDSDYPVWPFKSVLAHVGIISLGSRDWLSTTADCNIYLY